MSEDNKPPIALGYRELVDLAAAVRAAQRDYFAGKTRERLEAAKRLESKLDAAIQVSESSRPAEENGQGRLTVARYASGDNVRIILRRAGGSGVLEVSVTPAAFAAAITGDANVPCSWRKKG